MIFRCIDCAAPTDGPSLCERCARAWSRDALAGAEESARINKEWEPTIADGLDALESDEGEGEHD